MSQINPEELIFSFELGCQVHDEKISLASAQKKLVAKFQMNAASAQFTLRNISKLLSGMPYPRTMKAPVLEFYLNQIFDRFGTAAAGKAMQSVQEHLTNYPKGPQKAVRAVYEAYVLKNSVISSSLPDGFSAFDSEVEKAMGLSDSIRKNSLPPSGWKPPRIATTVYAFARNAAVAAEVRLRAKGICENCKNPAPFIKKGNGLPFLEVHHIVRLADEGEDTVENAMAVCPNCHRQLHYG